MEQLFSSVDVPQDSSFILFLGIKIHICFGRSKMLYEMPCVNKEGTLPQSEPVSVWPTMAQWKNVWTKAPGW